MSDALGYDAISFAFLETDVFSGFPGGAAAKDVDSGDFAAVHLHTLLFHVFDRGFNHFFVLFDFLQT